MYCTNCGKELPENSKFCNHCGARQMTTPKQEPTQQSANKTISTRQKREQMKKDKENKGLSKGCKTAAYVLAVILGLAIAIGVFGGSNDSTSKKQTKTTTEATTEAPIMISAKSLIKAYQENEINASNKYKGKYLKVTGYVDDIGQSDNLFMSDSYYIYIDDGDRYSFNDIRCSLNDESVEKAADFKPGDKIEIIGRCEGFSITSIDMYDCTIIK